MCRRSVALMSELHSYNPSRCPLGFRYFFRILTDRSTGELLKNEQSFRGDRMFLITWKTSLLFSRRTNRRRTNEDHLQEEEGALA